MRIFVFGIDGADPCLMFGRWNPELHNISKLMRQGLYAKINSTMPPSTIIAWSSFFSGADPGELGVYSYTYNDGGVERLVSSINKRVPMIWDIMSRAGKRCNVLYVPLTFPVSEINGAMVGCFLAPGISRDSVYPESLISDIRKLGDSEFLFDVSGFTGYKKLGTKELIQRVYRMTDLQLKIVRKLIRQDWDLFACVFIGSDRLQHMLWRYFDESHPAYDANSEFKDALKDYYIYLDKALGELMRDLPSDTVIIVSSDHGMVGTKGKINFNQWLVNEGYLVLKNPVTEVMKLSLDMIDWDKTVAYEVGAYQARVYFNKKNYTQKAGDEIKGKIMSIAPFGKKIDIKIFEPAKVYKQGYEKNSCPDLVVYFDNLSWGVNPEVGFKDIFRGSDNMADSAAHAPQGFFVMAGKDVPNKGDVGEINIGQVAPTMMKLLNIEGGGNAFL